MANILFVNGPKDGTWEKVPGLSFQELPWIYEINIPPTSDNVHRYTLVQLEDTDSCDVFLYLYKPPLKNEEQPVLKSLMAHYHPRR